MLQTQDSQLKIKIVFIGDPGTGKTNLRTRFCKGTFTEFSNPTVGLQMADRKFWGPFQQKQTLYSMVCWDIGAGNYEEYILPSYFRNALGVVYVYDVTKKQTFQHLQNWRQIVLKNMNTQHFTQMIIGNKTDLLHFRQVFSQQVQKWAVNKRIRQVFQTSALQNLYIQQSMHNMVKSIVQKFDETVRRPIKLDRKQLSHRGCL